MKLTPNEVAEIFLSDEKTNVLAAVYGVSENTIRSIKRRRSHTSQTGQMELLPGKTKSNRHILDDFTVIGIFNFVGTIKQLKNKYGVSKSVANNIKFRYTYKEVTESLGIPGELKLHKLSWDDVCTIRGSTYDAMFLASLFGISKSTVNNIRSGRTRQLK